MPPPLRERRVSIMNNNGTTNRRTMTVMMYPMCTQTGVVRHGFARPPGICPRKISLSQYRLVPDVVENSRDAP